MSCYYWLAVLTGVVGAMVVALGGPIAGGAGGLLVGVGLRACYNVGRTEGRRHV